MEKINSWRDLADDAIEEWFLNGLPESKKCFNQLLEVIVHFAGKNQPDKAAACADLLEDALKKNKAGDELLLLLEQRANWQTDPQHYAVACRKTLSDFFQGQSLMQAFLEASGLSACSDASERARNGLERAGVNLGEALRRLRVLRRLQPGTCCYEKTWGLGVVSGIDEFDRKLVVNFDGKPAHRLAFSYAAESLQPLDDDHFLALKLREPEKFYQWVKDNPGETVKAVLRQFGEMNLTRLRALMTGLVIPEKEWSAFWSSAREKLAGDPLVQMPARSRSPPAAISAAFRAGASSAAGGPAGRNEPIKILAEKKEFSGRWREDFLALRDVDRILAELDSLLAGCPPQNLNGELKQAVEDRLKFVARGMGAAEQPGVIIQTLLLADAANINPAMLFDISVYGRPEALLSALNSIPVRIIKPFLAYLEKNSLPITEALVQIMPQLLSSALNEAILHCRQSGQEEQLYEKMRGLIQEGRVSVDLLLWLGRNLQLVNSANICRPELFGRTALAVLQRSAAAGKRKDTGQLLRNIFTDKRLLQEMLQPLGADARLEFSRRLNSLSGLTAADKTAMAAKIIPLFPDLAPAFGAPAVVTVQTKLTSYRAYRERQGQLEKILKEEIPRNSKEIGVARGYGDLRENYEYKAAKEKQGLLMRRKAELEQMLSEVRGADFTGFPHDAAGQGTSVELKMPDGSRLVYHILGEWDSDEKLGIISCRSKLAEALNSHRAGDLVEIPGENSSLNCVIEAIRELPPAIREWINGGILNY